MKNEVVVVTGASAGVGRATARRFAREGAKVGLLARGRAGLEAAEREMKELGGQGLVLCCDVSDAEAVDAAAARVESELGPIDVWVNNAMLSVFSPFKEMTPAEFKRVTEATYLGQVYGTMAALRRMLPRDRGKIVQVGSALAYRAIPLQSAYCGAKHAIRGFTDSIRSELMHDKSAIQISMVQMPALNTPQFGWVKSRLPRQAQPVPPIFQPEVAAEAIFWAAHHDVRELPVGLNTWAILWLNKFFPSAGDAYLAWQGFSSQQTEQRRPPDQPDNLWEPLPGDAGAHGTFDSRATESCPQLWLATHGRKMALGALIGGGLLALAARRRR